MYGGRGGMLGYYIAHCLLLGSCVLGGAATCYEGFVICFLKVPLPCLGSCSTGSPTAWELSEDILQNLWNKWPPQSPPSSSSKHYRGPLLSLTRTRLFSYQPRSRRPIRDLSFPSYLSIRCRYRLFPTGLISE